MAGLFKKTRWLKAETLLEVIMAIFVVATGSATATSLIVSAMQSNSFSRDNLIALNLAVEGLEAIRNIRDSNWLKFGYDKEHCSNMRPEMPQGSDCEVLANLIDEGNYTVDLHTASMNWLLSRVIASIDILNLHDGVTQIDEPYRLEFIDLDLTVSTDGDADMDNDHDLFVSNPDSETSTGESQFYRMIQISYDNTPVAANEMVVKSTVQWVANAVVHQVILESKLTNYQKVKAT